MPIDGAGTEPPRRDPEQRRSHRNIGSSAAIGDQRASLTTMTYKQVSPDGLKRYQDDRFGMFVHWGLYALVGAHEWAMFRNRDSTAEYETLATRFEGKEFDAD